MLVAVADTHAVIWYIFADRRLCETARAIFENECLTHARA
jgi:PIN domain nuclease of toxin-antitoxin system